MNDILDKVNEGVGGLTSLVMNLLAGMGIVGNVVALINSIGSSGFVGLLSLVVLLTMMRGKD
jgi:hypothetical protein